MLLYGEWVSLLSYYDFWIRYLWDPSAVPGSNLYSDSPHSTLSYPLYPLSFLASLLSFQEAPKHQKIPISLSVHSSEYTNKSTEFSLICPQSNEDASCGV